MKKQLSMMTLLCLSFIGKAQNDKVTITTTYDDPKKNFWNVGVCLAGIDVQNKTSGGLYYMIHGRFTLAKFMTFSANVSMDLAKISGKNSLISTSKIYEHLDPYSHIEARASLHFSDKISELKSKVKLGTASSNGGTSKYSVDYTTKVRNVYALTASLNLMNHVGGQIDDSSADKRVMVLTTNNGQDAGFKGNAYLNQKNLVLGAGLHFGQYTHFKGTFTSGPTGRKTRRVKKSIEGNIEVLLGLAMAMGDKAYWENPDTKLVEEFDIKSVEKKRIGGRISADYGKNKIGFFQHFEMGYRPGLRAPNDQSKWLNQGYVNFGIGFGF
jgi:hypothetical protein